MRTFKVAIGGMVAAGKSTLLEGLRGELPDYKFLKEFDENDEVFTTNLRWHLEGKDNELELQTYFMNKHYQSSRAIELDYDKNCIDRVVQMFTDRGHARIGKNLRSWFAKDEVKVIVDRDIIEHWIFAYNSLHGKDEYLWMFYQNLFHAMYTKHHKPDVYILLDVNWDTFERNFKKRARPEEIEKFEEDKAYYERLHGFYLRKLKAQCEIYDVHYVVIDANDKSTDEVLQEALGIIDETYTNIDAR